MGRQLCKRLYRRGRVKEGLRDVEAKPCCRMILAAGTFVVAMVEWCRSAFSSRWGRNARLERYNGLQLRWKFWGWAGKVLVKRWR